MYSMNKKLSLVILFFISLGWCMGLSFSATAQTGPGLESRLKALVAGRKTQVGIAVILNGKDTVVLNNEVRYPMMSVFKFHQALAVAHYLEQNKLPLTTSLPIQKKDLRTDTYSPLRDKYPEGNINLSIGDLLVYTLQLSDNNACDILFDHLVGVKETDQYIRSLGLEDFSISATEEDMHRDRTLCGGNWTSPLEAAKLLEIFRTRPILADPYHSFVKQTLITCETGKDRLVKPLLGTEAVVGHKTGTGDRNEKGQLSGINDIGFVLLPDGQQYSIAVFVTDSDESGPDTEQLIATISETVYRYVIEN